MDVGHALEGLAKFRKTACLRAGLIIPALKQEVLLSRDREGTVLFADSAEFCKSLFSLPGFAKTNSATDGHR
jgi:hypothetical protein